MKTLFLQSQEITTKGKYLHFEKDYIYLIFYQFSCCFQHSHPLPIQLRWWGHLRRHDQLNINVESIALILDYYKHHNMFWFYKNLFIKSILCKSSLVILLNLYFKNNILNMLQKHCFEVEQLCMHSEVFPLAEGQRFFRARLCIALSFNLAI